MSLQSLLESANPYKSLQSDANRLASKWEKTGLLEGLNGTYKNNMGMILENQAKQLVVEANTTAGSLTKATDPAIAQGENWAGIALPLVRKVFGQIVAQEFVSVQPMNMPSGLVFFLDFQYGADRKGYEADGSLYGKEVAGELASNTTEGGFYGAGRFGYSVNEKLTASGVDITTSKADATSTDINYDSRLTVADYSTVKIALPADADKEAVRSFTLVDAGNNDVAISALSQFTRIDGTDLVFVVEDATSVTDVKLAYSVQPTDTTRGDFEDYKPTQADRISIPEINIGMKSTSLTAKTRKLKAVWTPEFAQDMNAYQNIDAEAEITAILSEHISMEIDLEILDMLIESANGGTERWSAKNNNFASADASGFTAAGVDQGGFYNTQGQWFQTLGVKIQKISNKIHQQSLRGGANFLVCAPAVATILESIPGFSTDTNGDVEKMQYAFGVEKSGSISGGKLKVYKNPYMTENTILLGYRGTQFLETGAVFAPYIPLIMTPMVYDPETFTPRKGLLTRYAKKMVRPEFYGKIFVEGLGTL